jgi:hypothetical protein
MSIISSLRRLITVCLGYKKEYPIITMNEIARSVRRRTSLFPSPEKDHCLSCGRKVTVGQMSRHVAHFPGCNVGYSRSRSHSAKKNRRPRKRSKRSDVNDVNDVDETILPIEYLHDILLAAPYLRLLILSLEIIIMRTVGSTPFVM